MTCWGPGTTVEQRGTVSGQTAHQGEPCRTCHGTGWYDLLTGPGVDPDRRHGTGAPRPDAE